MMYLYDSDMRSATEPDDKYYQAGYQWNLEQMNVQEAWSLGLEGQDMDGLTDMISTETLPMTRRSSR